MLIKRLEFDGFAFKEGRLNFKKGLLNLPH